jgi:hypothetical protein
VQIVHQNFCWTELNFHGYEVGIKTPLMSSHIAQVLLLAHVTTPSSVHPAESSEHLVVKPIIDNLPAG